MKWFILLPWFLVMSLSSAQAGEEGAAPILWYQKHISPVFGGKCPMHPSCSRYGLDAVKKHGPIRGWIMTCDRLMRCGRNELDESRSVVVNGGLLCDDPVSNNDFWLKHGSHEK